MFTALASLAVLFAAPPPPKTAAPPCKLAAVRAALGGAADIELIAGPVNLVARPGALATADCADRKGAPKIVQILVDPPIDFRARAALPDGRLVFGGTGGLVALDPVTLARTPLTTAPTYESDPPKGVRRCWAAEPGKPARGWDRAPRLWGDGRLAFDRGGPCGYEAEPTRTTMLLDLATGAVRPARGVAALLVTRSGAVLLGDGGAGCDERQTRGALWLSVWGGAFLPLTFADDEPMGVVALAETADGAVWALTGVCRAGASRGGNLWRAPPGGLVFARVEVPFRAGERGVDAGSGLVALASAGPKAAEVRVARPRAKGAALSWQASRDGAQWKRASAVAAPPKAPKDLARALGVGRVHAVVAGADRSWALTDDGAFTRARSRDAAWVRVFPGLLSP